MNEYTAILMEKIKLNDDMFVFKAKKALKGSLKKENGKEVFVDEDNVKHVVLTDFRMFDEGVAFPVKNNDLLQQAAIINIDIAKQRYFELAKTLLNIGFVKDDFVKTSLTIDSLYDLYVKLYNLGFAKLNPNLIKKPKNRNILNDNEILEFKWLPQYILYVIEDILLMRDMNEIRANLIDLAEDIEKCLKSIGDEPKKLTAPKKEENNMSEHEKREKELNEVFNNQKSKFAFDYKEVFEMMDENLIGRSATIDALLSVIDRTDNISNKSKKKSAIIIGPTGTGKTETFRQLKKALPNRPVIIVDTNQLTQEGYVGGTIEKNVLLSLLLECNNDLEKARHGIVIFDELDKRADTSKTGDENVNGGAVQNQLLKFMEGTVYDVPVGRNQTVKFDTSDLVVMACGAFQEIFNSIEEEVVKKKGTLGFSMEAAKESRSQDEVLKEKYMSISTSDLEDYGISSQLIGRFETVIIFPPHTVNELIELETNKSTSNLQCEIEYFGKNGVEVVWEESFIEEAAKEAYKLKTGGRALSNIISNCLGNLASEIKKNPGLYKIIYLPKEAVKDPNSVKLLKNDGSIVSVGDIRNKNQVEYSERKNINKLEPNKDALSEFLNKQAVLDKEGSKEFVKIKEEEKVKKLK
ncbi:MAG: AAA family ATPase [Bacilli bacterium]|nr:AAA family ATPase [Bacilli bacterium]